MIKRSYKEFLESVDKKDMIENLSDYFYDIEDEFNVDIGCIVDRYLIDDSGQITILITPPKEFKFENLPDLLNQIKFTSQKVISIGDFKPYPHSTSNIWVHIEVFGIYFPIIDPITPEKIVKDIEDRINSMSDGTSISSPVMSVVISKNWKDDIHSNLKIWLDFVKNTKSDKISKDHLSIKEDIKIEYTGKEDIHDQLLDLFIDIEDNFDVNVVIPKNFLIDGRPELGVNISPSTNRIEDVDILELFGSIWTSVRRLRKMGIFETLIYDSKGSWGQIRLSRNPFKDIIIKFNDLMISDPNMIINEIQNLVDMETIENWVISLDFQIPRTKYKEMTQLNENVSLAKSILKKSGIDSNSPEWNDYLKIREICGDSYGYVGILTRIRFEDGVKDMDEIRSIYDILKGSKIDLSKLNKMSYNDILDQFYDKFSKDNSDIEIVFSDSTYTYYLVKTYEGILEIGSPAWCLKTKSNWDLYQRKYTQQWVVVDNRYKSKLLTPKTTTLQTYSPSKGWTRFGFSMRIENDVVSWTGSDDGNRSITYKPENYTDWGVISTIFNLISGIKKSYWERFPGCQLLEGSKKLHKIVDLEVALKKLKIENSDLEISGSEYEIYLSLSESYSHMPSILILDEEYPRLLYPYKKKTTILPAIIGGYSKPLVDSYAKNSKSDLYVGIKLKNGIVSEEEANIGSVGKIDKWIIFDKGDRYLCVNLNPPNEYMIPTLTMIDEGCDIEEPIYFYLNKSNLSPVSLRGVKIPIKSHHQIVIDHLSKKNPKRIRGFWSFFNK